jgi:hypothetical protein
MLHRHFPGRRPTEENHKRPESGQVIEPGKSTRGHLHSWLKIIKIFPDVYCNEYCLKFNQNTEKMHIITYLLLDFESLK